MASQDISGPSSLMNGTPPGTVQFPNETANEENLSFQSLLISVSVSGDEYKEKILELALSASEELWQMAQVQEPLWLFDTEKVTEVLDEDEYNRRFVMTTIDSTAVDEIIKLVSVGESIDNFLNPNGTANPAPKTEASKSIGVVHGGSASIINILMNAEEWSGVFFNIVSDATTLGVLYEGEKETHNGALKVMTAKFNLPSTLSTPREVKFARICRQVDFTTWLVADVSLESVFPNPAVPCLQRRPSGCLIQQLKPDFSMITWIEHNIVQNGYAHNMFKTLLASNYAFNAKRWVSTLERYYDKIKIVEGQDGNSPQPNGLGVEGKNMLKLAERMVKCYAKNINPCMENSWVPLPISGAEEIFVRTSTELDDLKLSGGVVITISTSVLLPIPHTNLFEFLRDGSNRKKWDVLCSGANIREVMKISSTRNASNSVSRLMVESPATDKVAKLYLQESFTDSVAMYVVYAPVDVAATQHESNEKVGMVPCGFAMMPDKPGESDSGSILTISFQLVDHLLSSADYLPPKSVLTIHKMVCETVSLIKAALLL